MMRSGFRVSGLEIPGVEEFLGVRLEERMPSPSFSVGVPVKPGAIWTFEADDSEQAGRLLAEQQQRLAETAQRLDRAEQALDQLAQKRRLSAFAFSPASEPEAELLAAVRAIETPATIATFAARTKEEQEKRELSQQWQAFVTQVHRLVAHYAHIETVIAGQLVGQTTIGWTGDFETALGPACTPVTARVHQDTVHLTLVSRLALLRLVTIVTTGAAGLVVKAAVPGGQLLLLPAVWKFVRQVLQAWSEVKSPV